MVSKELAVGLMGFPLCLLNLSVCIPFRWRVHGSPPVAVLRAFTPMIRMQIIAKPVALKQDPAALLPVPPLDYDILYCTGHC